MFIDSQEQGQMRTARHIGGWRAGIANVKFSYPVHMKRRAEVTFLHYMFAIISLYLYAYLFISTSLITGPLSVCAAVTSTLVRHPISIFSFQTSYEVTIAPDCIVINFVSLTLYAQATVFFLVPFSKFILSFGQNHAFHAVELIGSNPRFRVLLQLVLLCYILSFGISQFVTGKFVKVQLFRSGNVHPNPGPVADSLRFCHWNINGVYARDKTKISLIEAYNSVFHYDIIALSETYLNESIKDEDIRIEGFGREIFHSDHPNGKKEGGVCLYFKEENLPIKRRKDLDSRNWSVKCQSGVKKVFFIAMHRSPNQSNEEFDTFYGRLQEIFDIIKYAKPHCVILTGDLNCRSKQLWSDDIDSPKGVALDKLTEFNNLAQLIDQPTNFEPRGKSCVDLIITDQPNLFVDYRIHSSLDNNFHQHIIRGKINISVSSPPPYKRQIWDYAKADKDKIR